MNIGIIGQGFVGTAVKEGLKKFHEIDTFDLDETKRDKIQTSFNNVKSFFRLLTKDKKFNWSKGTANVFATKEMLRNFFILCFNDKKRFKYLFRETNKFQ